MKIVAIQQCACGNGEVGEMWYETAIFPPETTLEEVFTWRNSLRSPSGRLMLTIGKEFTP